VPYNEIGIKESNVYIAYNFNNNIENEGLLKVTSSDIRYKSGNISETERQCYYRSIIGRKSCIWPIE